MEYIIGIDEVGRGALAGPVVVAAVLVRKHATLNIKQRGHRKLVLKDSKKLSAKQRGVWFEYFKNQPDILCTVAFVYPRQIEERNISGAANLAALRAYRKVFRNLDILKFRDGDMRRHRDNVSPHPGLFKISKYKNIKIFLDGGLFLGSRKNQPSHAKTIVKADERIPAVAIASIIAKVTRDRAMVRLGKLYPHYGFEIHKGYGTLVHRRAIKKHGPSEIHRKTFLKKL